MQYVSGRKINQDFGVPGITTNDTVVNVDGRIAVGIGTSATTDIDTNQIRIRDNIIDSRGVIGSMGYFLTKDVEGLTWTNVPPLGNNSIFLAEDGDILNNIGLQTYTGLNFISDQLLGITTNPDNPGFADIRIDPRWYRDRTPGGGGGIYTTGTVGIGLTQPRLGNVGVLTDVKLDVLGDAIFSGIISASSFIGEFNVDTQDLNVSGIASFTGNTDNVIGDTNTGIVQIDGGVGIDKNVSIGASLDVNNLLTVGSAVTIGNGIVSATTGDFINLELDNLNVSGLSTFGDTARFNAAVNIFDDLFVSGNISVGGTGVTLDTETIRIEGKELLIGFTTTITPNDTTANAAGIAVASTEGYFLVDLQVPGINTTPNTYKQIKWFKNGTFVGQGTDAFISNQPISIGRTQIQNGQLFAVGDNINFTEDEITAPTFVGNLTGTASTASFATTAFTLDGRVESEFNVATAVTATNVIGGIGSLTSLSVSGISTFVGIATFGTLGIGTANVIGDDKLTIIGDARLGGVNDTLRVGNDISMSAGIITALKLEGEGGTIIDISGGGTVITGIVTVGESSITLDGTNGTESIVIGSGITLSAVSDSTFANSVDINSDLDVSGVSTLGTVKISAGVVTATTGIVTYYGDGQYLENIISGVGIQSSGTVIGTGFTTLNFIGAGNTIVSIGNTVNISINSSEFAGFAQTAGIATNLAGGAGGQVVYQSATNTTAFLSNGTVGQVLVSNGGTNPPQWANAASSGGIDGITIQDEGSIVGSGGSISTVNFVGSAITATASGNISTITVTIPSIPDVNGSAGIAFTARDVIGGIASVSQLSVSGVSTFASDVDINAGLDVDGHTELDELNVSGVSTFTDVEIDGVLYDSNNATGSNGQLLTSIGTGVSWTNTTTTAAGQNILNVSASDTYKLTSSDIVSGVATAGFISPTVVMTGTGSVGIGTTNPKVKLQIDGILGFGTVYDIDDELLYTNIRIGDETTGGGGFNNIFMGIGAGNSNIDGSYNNFFGDRAGYYSTGGYNNNFLGDRAGYRNTTGSDNNFLGYSAGYCNTEGEFNNFFGSFAGYCNTGSYNNFLGSSAGYYNTTGGCNNFFGYYGGYYNTTGCKNNFIGDRAGYSNTTGSCNNMIGAGAGRCATVTGSHNNFLGTYAGKCASGSGSCNNFIGNSAGYYNTTGCKNNFFGGAAGFNNTTGIENNFFGNLAGYCNTTGCKNNFLGCRAGLSNTTGSCNNMIGVGAGRCATVTGSDNNFLGTYAGKCASGSGSRNNFIGFCAGYCNTTGRNNNFFGYNAGYSNTTGGCNNMIGNGAGQCATVTGFNNNFIGTLAGKCASGFGNDNNFFGRHAGNYNTEGDYNNFFGSFAGYCNTTGCKNNFFGSSAGYCNTTGCSNNFIGAFGGYFNTTGSNNNFFGNNAGSANTTGSCNNMIGLGAGRCATVTGSHNNFLGTYAGKCASGVGSGNNFFGHCAGSVNTTGCYNNFFGAYAGFSNTTGGCNNFIGPSAGINNTTGGSNNFIGCRAGLSNTTGSNNNFFGRDAGCDQTTGNNNVAIGYNVQLPNTTGSNQLVIGVGASTWINGDSSFNVGIGTTNPTSKLHVIGEVTATDYNSTSDARLKNNIQIIDDPLEKVLQINGVSFNWIEDNRPSLGVIADNIQEILPELVSDTDPKTVNYNGLIGLLIEVVKEQQAQIESLNERLTKLE